MEKPNKEQGSLTSDLATAVTQLETATPGNEFIAMQAALAACVDAQRLSGLSLPDLLARTLNTLAQQSTYENIV